MSVLGLIWGRGSGEGRNLSLLGAQPLLLGSFSHGKQGVNRAGPHHPLCGICLAEVIGDSAPTATLAVNLQVNSLFCEVLFTHIALPGAGCGCCSERLGTQNHSLYGLQWCENAAFGGTGEAVRRFGLPGRAGEGCCQQIEVLPHLC